MSNPINPVETTELVDSVFDTAAQGVESFADGVQPLEDLPDFFDEALDWPKAINGLAKGLPTEAKVVTPEQVDTMFGPQRQKLINAGMHPMLAMSIETNVKGIYVTYAAILQSGQEVVSATA